MSYGRLGCLFPLTGVFGVSRAHQGYPCPPGDAVTPRLLSAAPNLEPPVEPGGHRDKGLSRRIGVKWGAKIVHPGDGTRNASS